VKELDQLRLGLSPEATIAAFEAACNGGPGLLSITESEFAPYRARLLAALPAGLSKPVLEALRGAALKRYSLEAIVQFIEKQPMAWKQFRRVRFASARESDLEQALGGFFPWVDVEAAENDKQLQREHASKSGRISATRYRAEARNCPECGRPASELTWNYFSSPAWTWKHLCGQAGWLVICKPCHKQVEFFLEIRN
jgi:hypothetical protein